MSTFPTLRDKLAQTEGGKITSTIIDLFIQTNAMLEDASVVECNDGTSHKTTVRNGLPEVQFRKFYQGVPASKGEYTQVTDATGMLNAYSQVDKALADLNADTAQFRLNESQAFIQAMNNTAQENLIYGAKNTNPAGFDGFATRYNTISETPGDIGYQVIDAGGTGDDNTSIYLIGWGDRAAHLIYPKGTQAGIKREDKGVETIRDNNGNAYEAYVDFYGWDLGLSVRDYRACARVANIDVSDLEDTTKAADIIKCMVKAFYRAKKHARLSGAKLVWYVNETIETYLHLQARDKANVYLTLDEVAGQPIVKVLGIPVKNCDAILNTESKVS